MIFVTNRHRDKKLNKQPEQNKKSKKDMSKPSDVACYVDKCPICTRPGQGVYYMPWTTGIPDNCLEFVVHHGINGQQNPSINNSRNDFCYTGYYRRAMEGEIVITRRARPVMPPNWIEIRRSFAKKR